MTAENNIETKEKLNYEYIADFYRYIMSRKSLFILILLPMVIISIGFYVITPKTYTASAVIAPPRQSPTDYFMSNGANSLTSNNIARRVLGGGGGANNDQYSEYIQVLKSTRLAKTLIEKDHILQILYKNRWDQKKNVWKRPGAVREWINSVKYMIGIPVKTNPGIDDVTLFLNKGILVDSVIAGSGGANKAMALLNGSSYQSVSLSYPDKYMSVFLLSIILKEADNIIREDINRNVSNRILYLNSEIPNASLSDKRDALISVISGQEQLRMMLQADSTFASHIIDPPYASDMPTSRGIKVYILVSVILSCVIWIVICFIYWVRDEDIK